MQAPKLLQLKQSRKKALAAALLLSSASAVQAADISSSIGNVLKFGQADGQYGQLKLNLRYRYEYADTENTAPRPAHANTIRARLGYLTPELYGLQGFASYESVFALQNDYNGVSSGNKGFHVVADPADKHELNEFWITFKGIPDTLLKGGRQKIVMDDARFIGNVGWRQMEQTFDAFMLTNTSWPGVTLKGGYIGRVKNIFSRQDSIEAPFVNLKYKVTDYLNLTGYGYWLKYVDDNKNFGKSSRTFGLAINGSPQISEQVKLLFTLEYGYQEDHGHNPVSYHAGRYNIMGGIVVAGITAKAGIENLGSDEGKKAFSTPLGTNHKFQGWADRFLATPAIGVQDVHFTLAGKIYGAKTMFVYHNFQADDGNADFGNEFDFLVKKKFAKHYHVLAKYAYYLGDDDAPGALKNDTQKIWFELGMNF